LLSSLFYDVLANGAAVEMRAAEARSASASVVSNRLFGRRERSEPGRQAAKPPRRSAEREAVG